MQVKSGFCLILADLESVERKERGEGEKRLTAVNLYLQQERVGERSACISFKPVFWKLEVDKFKVNVDWRRPAFDTWNLKYAKRVPPPSNFCKHTPQLLTYTS